MPASSASKAPPPMHVPVGIATGKMVRGAYSHSSPYFRTVSFFWNGWLGWELSIISCCCQCCVQPTERISNATPPRQLIFYQIDKSVSPLQDTVSNMESINCAVAMDFEASPFWP